MREFKSAESLHWGENVSGEQGKDRQRRQRLERKNDEVTEKIRDEEK